jgi:benzoyl-CoA 2,3-dioxygenase component B
MALDDRIPNNVDLAGDRRLQKALEQWQPKFQDWWMDMGPEGFQTKDVYLRTAISVDRDGWATFDYVKMPDYRWGIFLAPEEPGRRVGFGDVSEMPAFDEVPGEFRNALRRLIVTQGDTEPASVEQQRRLGHTCPSLYDLRNLFQVNVEEGRHLWAMVYLLHRYFGKDGREEGDELLARRSGNADRPRILDAFNQPIPDWLSFYCFTMLVDRDGKYQLAALAESGFSPLRRTTQFMLTEEAHHLFVGETGISRVVRRSAELTRQSDGDPARLGGIPLPVVQRYINYWYTYALDLFGSEISSNAADFFASGLKGRYREEAKYEEHRALEGFLEIPVVEDGRLASRQVPLRNAMNELLRDEYIKDTERAIRVWNRVIAEQGVDFQLTLPDRRFHRHQGEYAGHWFGSDGRLLATEAEYLAELERALPSAKDRELVASLMVPVTRPGQMANWIAPPTKGINDQPLDFEYVRLN